MSEILSFKESVEKMIDLSSEKFGERLNASLNLKVLDCDEKERKWIDYRYDAVELHKNPYGCIHGGMACTLFDTCAGIAGTVICGRFLSTTDLSVSFIKPMSSSFFRIHVDYNLVAHKMIGAEARIFSGETDELCALGMIKYLKRSQDLIL